MDTDVRVVYRKYDGSLHWNLTMTRLGEDEYGVWTGAPAPCVCLKGDYPASTLAYRHVRLFPRDAWYTASFNAEPGRLEIYSDITTPPRWLSPGEVTMIDLDLDVCRRRDGLVALLDEDEFAEHQVRYGYPADVIDAAVKSASWLQGALADDTEPFASRYRGYLDLTAQLSP
jgi:uncharacterized protein